MSRPEPTLTDAEIMQAVCDGELVRFEWLVERYREPLLRVAGSKLGDRGHAEDVVQETFLAVFAARQTYNPDFSFRTWLWTILLNLCRRHHRKQQTATATLREIHRQGSEPATADTGLSRLLQQEQQELLLQLLDQLPEVQADALRLRFFGGLKFPEIAETMQCHLNAARQRVQTGLNRLAELLQQRESTEVRSDEG